MAEVYRAVDEPAPSRLDYWHHVVNTVLFRSELRYDEPPGERDWFRTGRLGQVEVAEWSSSPHRPLVDRGDLTGLLASTVAALPRHLDEPDRTVGDRLSAALLGFVGAAFAGRTVVPFSDDPNGREALRPGAGVRRRARARPPAGELPTPARGPAPRHRPVAAVALRLGFASPAHFTRLFRHIYGVTPGSTAASR